MPIDEVVEFFPSAKAGREARLEQTCPDLDHRDILPTVGGSMICQNVQKGSTEVRIPDPSEGYKYHSGWLGNGDGPVRDLT